MYPNRLVEEVKQKCNGIELQNEDVYMATTYDAFVQLVVRKGRGEGEEEFTYDAVSNVSLLLLNLYLTSKMRREIIVVEVCL